MTALTDGADVVGLCDAGGVEDFSAGGFEGLQATDGVVEIGTAVEVVFGAGNEHERKRQSAGGRRCRGDALDGVAVVVDGAGRGRRLRLQWSRRRDRRFPRRGEWFPRRSSGVLSVAIFEIGSNGQVGGVGDGFGIGESLDRG